MKLIRLFVVVCTGMVLLAASAQAGTYYTHITNASCQVTLTLSTNQVPVGETLTFNAVASGYRCGYTPPFPVMTIPVEVLLDGELASTLNAPWSPYGTTPVPSSITNLTVEGIHAVTIQHTNDFQYYQETVYSHTVYRPWPYSDQIYYNVYHYRTVPCSDAESFTVLSATGGTYLLAVSNGTGSGSYTNGEVVAITASNAPPGQVFAVWTGVTQYVASATSATTTVTMPTQDVSVTATYKTASDSGAITGFRLTTANSGSLVNGHVWTPGKYGGGLGLSNGQYVTVSAPAPDIFNITGDLTISLWANPNSVTCSGADPAYALVSKRSANHATPYELYIANGGSLILHYWGTDMKWPNFSATGRITTGAWQHIAVTRSFSGTSATVTFYINGVEAGSSTAVTGPALGSSDPVWISRDGYHTTYTSEGSYSGLMDEVQIYNRALSASEIALVLSNNCALVTDRVGNWKLDEDRGTTASDTVADGTINEDAKTITATVPVGTDVTALVPRITVSPLAAVDPPSGATRNFSSPVIYAVTAEDSTTQNHTVWVIYDGSDIDGNGLPDEWELDYFDIIGVDPSAVCANGANTVLDAYVSGLDPTNPSACFSITSFDGNMIEWSAVSGRVYSVFWTTNLLDGFQSLETNWAGGAFTHSRHGTADKCFYKIDVRLAP